MRFPVALAAALALGLGLAACIPSRPAGPAVTATSEATLAGVVRRANGRPFPQGQLVVSLVDPQGGAALAETVTPSGSTGAEVPFALTVAAGPLAAAGAEPRFAVRDARSGKAYAVERREQFYVGGRPTVVLIVRG